MRINREKLIQTWNKLAANVLITFEYEVKVVRLGKIN